MKAELPGIVISIKITKRKMYPKAESQVTLASRDGKMENGVLGKREKVGKY